MSCVPPGKVIAALTALPAWPPWPPAALELLGVGADLQVGVFLADRDALTGQVQPRQDDIGTCTLLAVMAPLADQVGHGRQDVRAVDAALARAQHQVVARGAPGRLLEHLDLGHAVLLEEALLVGHEQRRGIGQRDEAELGLGGLA
jgi:hypothetical protein